jgi:LmbE family N-acetylglucosaminyl deacetylase
VVASRLRRILARERACALTSYDRIGVYGHRDHVRVHEIAASAVLATGCDLIEATVSRVTLRRLRGHLLQRGLDPASWPPALVDGIGTDDSAHDRLVAVDVGPHLARKRAAIAAHASQVVEAPSFMGLPPGAFHRLLGTEWFRPTRTVDGRFVRLLGPSAGLGAPVDAPTHASDNSVLTGIGNPPIP